MLNTISLVGRVAHDLELKRTANGTSVCSFSIACDRDFKNADGNKETDFIDIVSFKNSAEYVTKYASKGSTVSVVGRLQIRSWEDKEGHKRRNAEVMANSIYVISGGKSDTGETGNSYPEVKKAPMKPVDDDEDFGELPF